MTRPDRSGDLLERALAAAKAVPPPPPPPIDSTRLSRQPSSIRWKVLAGVATLAAASCVFALTRRSSDAVALPFEIRAGAGFLKASPSGGWTATGPATFELPTAEINVEAGARFTVASATEVFLRGGRATFRMRHPSGDRSRANREFRLLAGDVPIRDRGTTFGVDVSPGIGPDDAGGRVLVTVTEGWVEAAGVEIGPGQGLAFVDRKPLGAAWPLDAKPTVSLETESDGASIGKPVVLRVVLANPTDGWIPWPSSGAVENPVHVEVTGPDGSVAPVRVTDAMLVDGPTSLRSGRAIPPRGQAVLRVRFDRTFASPGTYRLRAIFRPAEAVEDPASASILLTVLAEGAPLRDGPSTPGRPR